MDVENKVVAAGEVSRPELFALEATLEHDWNLLVHACNVVQHGLDALEDPSIAGVGESSWSAEGGEVLVICWLVHRLDEVLDEGNCGLDNLHRVDEVGFVVVPVPVAIRLADSQTVDTTGQAVDIENDVHAVLLDSRGGNLLAVLLLIARVQL